MVKCASCDKNHTFDGCAAKKSTKSCKGQQKQKNTKKKEDEQWNINDVSCKECDSDKTNHKHGGCPTNVDVTGISNVGDLSVVVCDGWIFIMWNMWFT